MSDRVTVDQVVEIARQLSPLEKLKVIERLAPDLEVPLSSQVGQRDADLDEQYQRGYEQIPEDPTDAEALMPHLPLSEERWE
ncbi:MAG TPA: hypothetical protein VH370_24515 [Humisphaera sp.]|jgi:hypothetical protein|nr:hypothetical protein [Humisphaera sp.]